MMGNNFNGYIEFSKDNSEFPSVIKNEIVCNDSLVELKKLPDNCVDIIITSPPYNYNMDYTEYNDNQDYQKYFEWLNKILFECIRVLKYSGRLIINIQPQYKDNIPTHHIISNFLISNGMLWKGEILWEKNNYNCAYTAWGSWKSPSSPYLKYTWEFIEVFCKGDLKKIGDKNNIDITGDEFKEWVTAKWNIAPEHRMKEFNHPAMFPEKLIERLIKLFSFKGDIVLDPFNGVGTTTYVANKLGRQYFGIDISQEYCNTARDRINND